MTEFQHVDIEQNTNLIARTLNHIYDHAKKTSIESILELKQVFPAEIIEACCRVASVTNESCKKRSRNLKTNQKQNKKVKKNVTHRCYICRTNVVDRNVSHFCNDCTNINIVKRSISANLTGKIAIVTGCRVKIGFETVIRLLECDCTVIATTRFVADALDRYSQHPKYSQFKSRLTIYPLDLKRKSNIDNFCDFILNNFTKLDILINNAAQTIRRPKEFFEHLIEREKEYGKLLLNNSDNQSTLTVTNQSSELTSLNSYNLHLHQVFNSLTSEDKSLFPADQYDQNGEQVDLRKNNTWIKELGDVETEECVECFAINALAPFHLNQRLKPLLAKANGSYIVNVSSMEGVFNMRNKTSNHPHTNMAKSALNMMTRTSAKTYARDNIYMVSVDTGWITNEFPNEYESRNIKQTDHVPLSNLDGACRVLDPVFEYYNTGKATYGVFLKDYVQSNW